MGLNEWLALIGALGGLEAIKWVINFYVNRKTNARKEGAAADSMENENERKQIAWLEERIAQRDAKHGENTPGKCSPDGRLKEWAYTREIADRVVAGLRHRGEEAERIVKEDVDIPLSIRCRRVNKIYQESGGNAILISIHCNAAALGIDWLSAHGWSVFVSNNASANSKCLATSLADS